jgi:DNA-binding response OmpR family regulator
MDLAVRPLDLRPLGEADSPCDVSPLLGRRGGARSCVLGGEFHGARTYGGMNPSDDAPSATILVAEDDPPVRTFLADELTADGCELLVTDCGRDALRLLESKYPDLAVLDVGLPDGSGLDLVRRVRASDGITSRLNPELPLLVLSGRCGEHDRVRAFDAGADDFLAKPFAYPELRWRIHALLRRADRRPRRSGRLRVGTLEIDPASRTVRVSGHPVSLTQTEFTLLRTLASSPTTVHTKKDLLRALWGYRATSDSRALDSHACRLRSKLSAHGAPFVLNVWGVGYRLIDLPEPDRQGTAP